MEEQNYPGRPRKYDDKVIWEKYDEFVAKYKLPMLQGVVTSICRTLS